VWIGGRYTQKRKGRYSVNINFWGNEKYFVEIQKRKKQTLTPNGEGKG